MPGKVRYIGRSPNQAWHPEGMSGDGFEELLHGLVSSEYAKSPDTVYVTRTPRSHDEGKDLIIDSHDRISILGFPIPLEPRQNSRVFVECKTTGRSRLRLDSFGKNFLQTRHDTFQHFVLVTNGSITPHAYFVTKDAFAQDSIGFTVIDNYWLLRYLTQRKVKLDLPPLPKHDNVVLEYQTQSREVSGSLVIDLYIWIRNYSDNIQACHFFVQSDRNWKLDQPDQHFFLGPYETRTLKLRAVRQYANGRRELEIAFRINELHDSLKISADRLWMDFTPRLHGEQHLRLIRELTSLIDEARGLSIVNLTGEAGIGKSRIIDEVIERRSAGNVKYVQMFVGPGDPTHRLKRFVDNFDTMFGTKFGMRFGDTISPVDLVTLFREFHSEYYTAVFILEDLHHTDRTLCDALRVLVDSQRKDRSPAVIILTGRNDYTFPNPHYFGLLDFLAVRSDEEGPLTFNIQPLSDDEAHALIRSTIEGIPAVAVKRIHDLSMNVPFNVVQCIEYLLETNLARIRNRYTVGIPNVQRFAGKDWIPQSMEDIFKLRLKSLESETFGDDLRRFLLVASFFGNEIPNDVCDIAFDGNDMTDASDALVKRRFIRLSRDGSLIWYHENLLHFFARLAKQPVMGAECAGFILARPAVFLQLPQFEQARIAFIARQPEKALHLLTPISEDVERIDNFSSENLPAGYAPYLPILCEVLKMLGGHDTRAAKILLAQAYMGIHNLPLVSGIEICRDALSTSRDLKIESRMRDRLETSIKQLIAHGEMNVGWLRRARRTMLEIDCALRLSTELACDQSLQFDLYNRLQDLYRYYNHLSLAESYGRLAERVAGSNPKLLSVHRIGTAVLYRYIDLNRCIQLSEEALAYARTQGMHRHERLAELGLLSAVLSRDRANTERVADISLRAEAILEDAISNTYTSMIPRACLLSSTAHYLLAKINNSKLDSAWRLTERGIEACVRHGIGHYVWQLYNMRALLYAHDGASPDQVFKQFSTAIEHLDASDLLFLGNRDFCCANLLVISNYLLFLLRYDTEEHAYRFLRRLTFYDDHAARDTTTFQSLLSTMKKSSVLYHERRLSSVLYDETTSYSLSVF